MVSILQGGARGMHRLADSEFLCQFRHLQRYRLLTRCQLRARLSVHRRVATAHLVDTILKDGHFLQLSVYCLIQL